ncbi:MAG TPA: tRNA uridine-5-carboxymethylaminomethyl(34) synthesis enzyme MnmG, partial [Kofleriaceae bacterium]|nr:tRNA uridine-5-carboxymethylaminomethyl(34) synthesis enzyme MnmG [Kofleriaceae bacterium]
MPIGRRLGLVSDERWRAYEAFAAALAGARELLAALSIAPSSLAASDRLAALGSSRISDRRVTLGELMRRPEIGWAELVSVAGAAGLALPELDAAVAERLEIEIKYEGYLARQESDARRLQRHEEVSLPADLDYRAIPGLSAEVIEKLSAARPRSLGQASRLSGVTPVAVTLLMTHLDLARRRRAAGPSASTQAIPASTQE